MGRIEAEIVKKNNYKFVLEFDMGGAPGGDYTCWIYHNGKPLLRPDNYQVRKYFGTICNKIHFHRFVNKFVNDESYRNKYIMMDK